MVRGNACAIRAVALGAAWVYVALSLGCAEKGEGEAATSLRDARVAESMNTLSADERADGWTLLFDGRTTSGWRRVHDEGFPDRGWEVRDGALVVLPSGADEEAADGGDIVTIDRYGDFDLSIDFRLRPGANSGIKYMVDEGIGTPGRSAIGLEYQLIDDFARADAESTGGKGRLGGLYDLIAPPVEKPFVGAETWHTARIVSKEGHVEHWLNGTKLIEFDRSSDDFRRRVDESKFKSISRFGKVNRGHILLQDHGDGAAFRNIKIKAMQQPPAS
jgi:Domain of Unknown Function (DUF1080)